MPKVNKSIVVLSTNSELVNAVRAILEYDNTICFISNVTHCTSQQQFLNDKLILLDEQTYPISDKDLEELLVKNAVIIINCNVINTSKVCNYISIGVRGAISSKHSFSHLKSALVEITDGGLWFDRKAMEYYIVNIGTKKVNVASSAVSLAKLYGLTKKETFVCE